jgi:hypothetical protein
VGQPANPSIPHRIFLAERLHNVRAPALKQRRLNAVLEKEDTMNRFKMSAVTSALVVSGLLGAAVAHATPTDSAFPWSLGGLRVAELAQGSDNEVYVKFKNGDGTIRKLWPNSAGTDLCGGTDTLRLARARTNFQNIVETLTAAGLAGRNVWVAYEPTSGVCYVKSVSVTLQ